MKERRIKQLAGTYILYERSERVTWLVLELVNINLTSFEEEYFILVKIFCVRV